VSSSSNQATGFNLEQSANGLIAVSHIGADETFTLELRSTLAGKLSELLTLNNRITVAEGYTEAGVTNLQLRFIDGVATDTGGESAIENIPTVAELRQNVPNPFAGSTQISFALTESGFATLRFRNIHGQVVLEKEIEGIMGENNVMITRDELKGFSGVLTYTLTAGEFTATRKMVVQ
jgi:hypothetical protein